MTPISGNPTILSPAARADLASVGMSVDSFLERTGAQIALVRCDGDINLYRAALGNGPCVLALAGAGSSSSKVDERLLREYRLLSELDCPAVISPVGTNRVQGKLTMFLEDPGGISLDGIVAGPRGGAVKDLLDVACKIATSVRQIHDLGLLHGDLRPGNCFLDASSNVKLTGFGLAGQFIQTETGRPIEVIAGTLAYMAPERTGRMNRIVDFRSDLYALGITLFEIFTGTLPFEADSVLEWTHLHLAGKSPKPSERNTQIPSQIDAIILKLLEKNPDDRYQSAAAVENDLRRCLKDFSATESVERFQPAKSDILSRRQSRVTLFGRDDSRQLLINAVDRVVVTGESEFVLVSGPPGIGKSSLIEDLSRNLDGRGVFFATGKFDQHKFDVPYATLGQAFSVLVKQLLGKDERDLATWRQALANALGTNAQLIVDLIPELAFILGPQPAAAPADLTTAKVRFHFVFRAFLAVFATAKHPLVLFIDDLQWLDAATLDLIRRLVGDPDLRHVLFVGAYRSEESDHGEMLASVLHDLRALRGRTTEIRLQSLQHDDLVRLLANTLATSPERVATLADLVNKKTGGNPFFTIQFIRQLAADGSLFFQPHSSEWSWNASAIRGTAQTANVGQLLSLQLDNLPHDARDALGKLSLLGNITDVRTAALVLGMPIDEVKATLEPALDAGLMRLTDETLSFAHDHVQSAAYSSVDIEKRSRAHLGIGRLLLANTERRELEERIFEIVAQFDRGISGVTKKEAPSIARLYLTAGQRAKSASAYSSARGYFERGRSLVSGSTPDLSQLAFQLELNQVECEIVIGNLSAAEERLAGLMAKAQGSADKADAVCLAVLLYFTTGRSARAVEIGVNYLQKDDLGWPAEPTVADVESEFLELHRNLADTTVDALDNLPEMTDPRIISTVAVMTEVFPAAYAVDRRLMEFLLLRMANLSVRYGNCESSPVAYAALNMALGVQFGDYKTAYAFGELARRLVDQAQSTRYKARVYSLFAGFATPWIRPLSESAPLMAEAFRISCSTGDLAFAAYNTRNRITHEFMSGKPLERVQTEVEEAVGFAKQVQLGLPTERFFGQLRLISKLRGLATAASWDVDSWALTEQEPQPGVAMMTAYHWVYRLIEQYLTEDFHAAEISADRVETIRWAMRSSVEEAEYGFYAGLTYAALADRDVASSSAHGSHFDALRRYHDRMSTWAENCASNFSCREALLAAERARLEGHDGLAQTLYEKSIQLSRTGNFLQVEAIANELAGRFYASRGLSIPSDAYLRAARDCYRRWGCIAKVRLLDLRYLHLSEPQIAAVPSHTIEMPVTSLDIEAVVRASRVLSSEMVLSKLIEKLMRLSIQQAGAERGVLLLLSKNELYVEATATTRDGTVEVALDRRPYSTSEVPDSIIQYVLRARGPAVLDDLTPSAFDVSDAYFQQKRPKSVLCVPIFNATEVIGLLYVENDLASGIFASDRIAALDFLASQAGIWLGNSRLYSDLQRSEAWLREAQRLSRTGSFYWHDDLDELECSEEIYRILELPPELSITIHTVASLLHPSDQHSFIGLVENTRISGADIDRILRLQLAGGLVKVVRLVTRSGVDRMGKRRHLGSLQDVTEMQHAQDALGKVRSELAQVSRTATLGVLTASIAHEVSQPLLGIVANAETCQMMLEADPPNIKGAMRTAQRSLRDGYRAAETIKRLRSLFGSKNVAVEKIGINDVVHEVLVLSSNELQTNDVLVLTDLEQHLPFASGDRVQVQQVILNLLLNAVDAVRTNHVSPKTIVIRTRTADNDDVQIDVVDNGTGFQPGSNEKMFEAFYTTKDNGMGVGLSVSRAIIDSFGGRLWASRNDKEGATFSFTLKSTSETVSGAAGKAANSYPPNSNRP